MIDCHAHLAADVFDGDRTEVLERARAAGVVTVVVVGEDADDDERVLDVCGGQPAMLSACVGIHPDRWGEDRSPPGEEQLQAVCDLARRRSADLIAIGEVGLDYWYAKSDERRAAQRDGLARMVQLSTELDLPVNVHSRSAGHQTIALLESCGAERVLMHAFDGKASHAVRAAQEHGWLFSIPPSVLRSPQKQKLVKRLPLASLALESDSPVLGPDRGERNEPANLVHVVRYMADVKGVCQDEVREVTTANARRLFGR